MQRDRFLPPDFSVTAATWKRAAGLLLEELKYTSLDTVWGRQRDRGGQGGDEKKSHVPDLDQQCSTTGTGASFSIHIDLGGHQYYFKKYI